MYWHNLCLIEKTKTNAYTRTRRKLMQHWEAGKEKVRDLIVILSAAVAMTSIIVGTFFLACSIAQP